MDLRPTSDERELSRRRLLAAGVVSSTVGLAGCISEQLRNDAGGVGDEETNDGEDADKAETESAGFVDNGSDDPDQNIVVDVTVVDEDGDPVPGVGVELEDRGGTPDDRFGETGPKGRLRFVESVGPPPCNSQTLIVSEYGERVDLGCNNGGVELTERITIDR